MRLLQRRRMPRTKTLRPAEPYLVLGADEARRRGHNYIGTGHLLLILVRDLDGGATQLLARLSVSSGAVERALACWLGRTEPSTKIDPAALATLGIDFDAVRERVEQTFGPGALEQTRSACLDICPRLKLALAYALDHAAGRPLTSEHVLLGMLSVADSVAARVLGELGVTLTAAQEVVDGAA